MLYIKMKEIVLAFQILHKKPFLDWIEPWYTVLNGRGTTIPRGIIWVKMIGGQGLFYGGGGGTWGHF